MCTLVSSSSAFTARVMVLAQWPQVRSFTSKIVTSTLRNRKKLMTGGFSAFPSLECQASKTKACRAWLGTVLFAVLAAAANSAMAAEIVLEHSAIDKLIAQA